MRTEPLDLSDADRDGIEARGLTTDEVGRQVALLREPAPAVTLVRPCTISDGVERIAEREHGELLALADEAARSGRLSKFVPASGAASRMFASVCAGAPETEDTRRFRESRDAFPFRDSVEELSRAPKALIPFHAYPEGARTAFEEHLFEAAGTIRDAGGLSRIHFTVSPEHRRAFEDTLGEVGPRVERATGARFVVEFSEQSPSTDTIALDESGNVFRDADGRILFRPGGHGSVLKNLQESGGDIVLLKNIDNVV